MEPEIYPPPIRGFLYDLTVTTTTHIQARWFLSALEDIVSGAGMKVQAEEMQMPRTEEGARGQASQYAGSRRGDPISSRKPN